MKLTCELENFKRVLFFNITKNYIQIEKEKQIFQTGEIKESTVQLNIFSKGTYFAVIYRKANLIRRWKEREFVGKQL